MSRWTKIQYKAQGCVIPPMTCHAAAGSNMFMYVYDFTEAMIYRFDTQSLVWHKLKRSLKTPKTIGPATMQLFNNFLYLFANCPEGARLFRLNLEKAWLWVPRDLMTDYSVI